MKESRRPLGLIVTFLHQSALEISARISVFRFAVSEKDQFHTLMKIHMVMPPSTATT